MAIKTFDPAQIAVIVGPHIVEGFANEEFVSVSFQDDDWEHTSGADGEEMRTKKNDRRAVMTLTLLQSSASNDYLSGLRAADQASNNGVVPVLLKDNNGSTIIESVGGWIGRNPDVAMGKSPSNREWMIHLSNATAFVGGSTAN